LLAADPIAIDELGEEGAIDASRCAQIDIFDDCGLPQRGELQAHDEPFVLPLGRFAIDHQAEPLLEGERGDVGLAELIVEGLGHAGEPEGGEAFMRAKPHPEQGFRSCLGILRMEKTYGAQRLEAACRRGISIGAASYRSIASILKTGLDKAFLPDTNPDADPIQHGNIRGRGYYH
jgi:hypothetical protein